MMRRSLVGLLTLTLLVGACKAAVPSGVSSKAKKPTTQSSAKPTAAPSSAKPTPAPSPVIDAAAISGLLKMDASYVVAAGGGNVIAAGGGNVIAAGGGNLISVGGQVIAAGGGNVIAAGGGNVIAAGGGNVIAAGGGNYRVSAIEVPFGTLLPAAHMAVVPISLRTGKPLGPAVLTDDTGHYTVNVPKTETGNWRILAAVPGTSESDPHLKNAKLQSESFATLQTQDLVMDDDRALVTAYFRRAFIGHLAEVLDVEVKDVAGTGNPLFDQVWGQLIDEALASQTHTLPESVKQELAGRMADNLISYVDFASAKNVLPSNPTWDGAKSELAFDAFLEVLKTCRVAAAGKMATQSDYFDEKTFVKEANARVATPYVIRKPTDLGEFIVTEYLLDAGKAFGVRPIFEDMGVEVGQFDRLYAAEQGLIQAIGLTMIANSKAQDALRQLIRDAKK